MSKPLYLFSPTRAIRQYASDGKRVGAVSPTIRQQEDAAALVAAYDAVCRRENRTCQVCHYYYLDANRVRMWVKDQTRPLYEPDNLELLCGTCCRRRAPD